MKRSLTEGLDKDQAEEIEQLFRSSTILRKRVVDVLEKKIDAAYRELVNKETISSPNWNISQAERIGYINSMKDLTGLLK